MEECKMDTGTEKTQTDDGSGVRGEKREAEWEEGSGGAKLRAVGELRRKVEVGKDGLPCVFCPKSADNWTSLLEHFVMEPGIFVYACHLCGSGFTNKSGFQCHPCPKTSKEMDATTMKLCYRFIICSCCGFHVGLWNTDGEAKYRELIKSHNLLHLRNLTVYSARKIHGQENERDLKIAFLPWIKDVPLRCQPCGQMYTNGYQVQSHSVDHGIVSMNCPECNLQFGSKLFYKHHLVNHHINVINGLADLAEAVPDEAHPKTRWKPNVGEQLACDLCGDYADADTYNEQHDCAVSFTRRLLVDKQLIKCPAEELKPTTCIVTPGTLYADKFLTSLADIFKSAAYLTFTDRQHTTMDNPTNVSKWALICDLCLTLLPDEDKFVDHIDCVHSNFKKENIRYSFAYLNRHKDPATTGLQCPKCSDIVCSLQSLQRHLLLDHDKWMKIPEGLTLSIRPKETQSRRSVNVARKTFHGASGMKARKVLSTNIGSDMVRKGMLILRQGAQRTPTPVPISNSQTQPNSILSTSISKPQVLIKRGGLEFIPKPATPTPLAPSCAVESSKVSSEESPGTPVSKNWVCPVCKAPFSQLFILRSHLQSAHLHICKGCAFCFVSESARECHKGVCKGTLRSDAIFFCYICSLSFSSLPFYYNHLINSHSSQVNFDDKTGQVFPICGALVSNRSGAGTSPSVTVSSSPPVATVNTVMTTGTDTPLVLNFGGKDLNHSSNTGPRPVARIIPIKDRTTISSLQSLNNSAVASGKQTLGTTVTVINGLEIGKTGIPRVRSPKADSQLPALYCPACIHKGTRSVRTYAYKSGLLHHVVENHVRIAHNCCALCSSHFSSKEIAAEHVLQSCPAITGNTCKLCFMKLQSPLAVNVHMVKVHKAVQLQCNQCQQTFSKEELLRSHLEQHELLIERKKGAAAKAYMHPIVYASEDGVQMCPLCSVSVPKFQMTAHVKAHRGNKFDYCGYCHMKFMTVRQFTEHMKIHTGEDPPNGPPILVKTSKGGNTRVKLMVGSGGAHSSSNFVSLPLDHQNTASSSATVSETGHSGSHTLPLPPLRPAPDIHLKKLSDEVGGIVKEEDDLIVLSSDEEDEKSASNFPTFKTRGTIHKCNVCTQTFQTFIGLKDHLTTHAYDAGATTSEVLPAPLSAKIHICRLCSLAYQDETVFRRHMSKHGAHNSCLDCSSVCFTEVQAKTHTEAHKQGKILYGCVQCRQAFKGEIALYTHNRHFHGAHLIWFCKSCGFGHGVKVEVVAHINACHVIPLTPNNPHITHDVEIRLGVCPHKKLHFQPQEPEAYQNFLETSQHKLVVGDCVHRSFLTYNETLLCCPLCGTAVPAHKFMLENAAIRKAGQLKLELKNGDTTTQIVLSTVSKLETGGRSSVTPTSVAGIGVTASGETSVSTPTEESASLLRNEIETETAQGTSKTKTAQDTSTETGKVLEPETEKKKEAGDTPRNPVPGIKVTLGRSPVEPNASLQNTISVPPRASSLSVTDAVPSLSTSVSLGIGVSADSPKSDSNTPASTSKEGHLCTICTKDFPTKAALKVHQLKHSGTDAYFCLECGSSFRRKAAFETHLAETHFRKKAQFHLKCPACDHISFSLDEFREHLSTETECFGSAKSKCGRLFFTTEARHRHNQRHSRFGAHCCPLCDVAKTSEHELETHVVMEHVFLRWLMCRECGLCFTTEMQLSSHFIAKHVQQTDEISMCCICAINVPDLLSHVSTHQVFGYKGKLPVTLPKNFENL